MGAESAGLGIRAEPTCCCCCDARETTRPGQGRRCHVHQSSSSSALLVSQQHHHHQPHGECAGRCLGRIAPRSLAWPRALRRVPRTSMERTKCTAPRKGPELGGHRNVAFAFPPPTARAMMSCAVVHRNGRPHYVLAGRQANTSTCHVLFCLSRYHQPAVAPASIYHRSPGWAHSKTVPSSQHTTTMGGQGASERAKVLVGWPPPAEPRSTAARV